MSRYFTLQQAARLLPQVERAIREAADSKAEHARLESEFHSELQRIMMLGGVDLNRAALIEKRQRRDCCAVRLKKALDAIEDIGCLVKDLDIGLVDFPTLFRGEEVYLCWKLGETSIGFWHGVSEGFRGRKPIDQYFIDHHKAGRQN